MTESPTSQQRTNLIRQMARDLQKSRPISISSRVSDSNSNIDNESTSEFNPSSGGLGSTRNMDEQSQELPAFEASAQDCNQRATATDIDYRINTSALGRAFPNFSRSGSEREDDSSRSIEIGRGVQKRSNVNNDDSSVRAGGRANPSLSAPVSKKEAPGSLNRVIDSRRRSLEKETSRGSPPTVKATDYVSNESRQGSGEEALPHTQVEENDTQLSDDRPPTVNVTSRSSRFAGAASTQAGDGTLPKTFISTKDFLKNMERKRSLQNNGTVTSNFQSTLQSHLFENMPNISELITGTLEDGSRIFSCNTPARKQSGSTRFASQQGRKSRFGYYPVGSIAIPEDEKAIFVSLKLLQEKLAELEGKCSEQEAQIQILEDKNRTLERERIERKRLSSRDSGIGHTSGSDADDDFARSSRKTIIERTRLETTIRTLQEKLDTATKKVKTSEIAIKNMSSERDSAVSQLGVAYVNMEQLKVDKETLLGENEALKAEILALQNQGRRHPSDTTTEEYGKTRNDLERAASRESAPTTRQDYTQILDINTNVHHKEQPLSNRSTAGPSTEVMSKAEAPRRRKTRLVLEEYSESEHSDLGAQEGPSTSQAKSKGKAPAALLDQFTSKKDETILSAASSSRFVDLRQVLEKDRWARQPRSGAGQNTSRQVLEHDHLFRKPRSEVSQNLYDDGAARNEGHHTETILEEPRLPRKSSMKTSKTTSRSRVDETTHSYKNATISGAQVDLGNDTTGNYHTVQSKTSAKGSQPINGSSHEPRSKRKSISAEEMTSAFIIPDITMRNPGEATIKLSQSAREVFDRLAQHDGHNCTICKRVIEHGVPHSHDNPTKVTVPKPIPVSDRMPSPGPDDEPTMRPSQPPAVALATVLKGLEDELKHLKIKLAEYQALYNRHDPALSKRKRKAVFDAISKLLATIDTKADQIYALYDVLEGQKQSGMEMNSSEVEITPLKIGVDPQDLSLRGGHVDAGVDSDGPASGASSADEKSIHAGSVSEKSGKKAAAAAKNGAKKVRHAWDLSSEDEEELPWEGFETTGEMTGRSSGSGKRRG